MFSEAATKGKESLLFSNTRGGSRTAATSKMKRFVIIVNDFQLLTIITKCSVLDVAAVLDPPLSTFENPHLSHTPPSLTLPFATQWMLL